MASVRDYYCAPDLYDVIYSDISDDVAFWVGCAQAAAGPVLELACGNGRLLVPCAAAGADIEGLDLTPAMVESLRGKLAARRLRAEVAVGDMRDFARARRYALIFVAFNSFLHNLTQEDQLATLAHCREHLARFKCPRDLRFQAELPRSEAGKIVKRDLCRALEEG